MLRCSANGVCSCSFAVQFCSNNLGACAGAHARGCKYSTALDHLCGKPSVNNRELPLWNYYRSAPLATLSGGNCGHLWNDRCHSQAQMHPRSSSSEHPPTLLGALRNAPRFSELKALWARNTGAARRCRRRPRNAPGATVKFGDAPDAPEIGLTFSQCACGRSSRAWC